MSGGGPTSYETDSLNVARQAIDEARAANQIAVRARNFSTAVSLLAIAVSIFSAWLSWQQHDESLRASARQVFLSITTSPGEPPRTYIENRGDRPAQDVAVSYSVGSNSSAQRSIQVGDLPPCSRVLLVVEGAPEVIARDVYFTADGRSWRRTERGVLDQIEDRVINPDQATIGTLESINSGC